MKDAVQKSSYLQMRENLSTANKNARTQTYTHMYKYVHASMKYANPNIYVCVLI